VKASFVYPGAILGMSRRNQFLVVDNGTISILGGLDHLGRVVGRRSSFSST
jgi:hypothetical protein